MRSHRYHWVRSGVALLLAIALPACIRAAPTTVPPLGSATSAPTTPEPTADILLILGPGKEFQGVQFRLPTTLASAVDAQVAPAADKLGELYPAHAEFTLVNYNAQNTVFEPQIEIYPVRELGRSATQTVQELKGLLAAQPTTIPAGIPILPTIPAGQLIDVQIQYLTFTSGSGIRVLTQFAQDSWPIHNEGLVYVFQGLTSDDAYYISAFLPVAAAFLPDHVDNPAAVPAIDGISYPQFNSSNFGTEYSHYRDAITNKLNTTPTEGFLPDLSMLDNLIESLQIESATTSDVVVAAVPTSSPTLALTTTPLPFAGLEQIAFVSDRDGNDEIYVMNADGGEVRRLTDNPASDWNLEGSSDGTRIVFVSDRDGNDEIYVMKADGSEVRRLTNNPSWDRAPVWSPDGTQIVFVSDRDSPLPGDFEIYVMNADGSNQTRVTNNQTKDFCPTWSPDGKQIAFSTYSTSPETRIEVINGDGSGRRPLIDTPGEDRCPVWSPDGTQIAFVSGSSGHSDIYLVDPDGSNLSNLTNDPGDYFSPQWSPDGKHLVFHFLPGGEIYRIGADGHGLTNLTNNPGVDRFPSWLAGNPNLSAASSTTESQTIPCLNAPPTRLSLGLYAYVNPDPPLPNNLRSDAGKNNSLIGDIQPGKAMKILEAPKCADGWVWWKVRTVETELEGWTPEGDQQNYWLIPCASRNACGP